MTPLIQVTNADAGGTSSRRYDSSRCVWALTRPGRIATSPRSTTRAPSASTRFPAAPSATTRPRSTASQPSRIGRPLIGRIQAAWYLIMARQEGRTAGRQKGARQEGSRQELRVLRAFLLRRPAPRWVEPQFLRHAGVAVGPGGRQCQHAWHVALAEDW